MNQTHIHLLINHLPIFGSVLGALVLTHGLWAKSNPTKIAAYNIFILSVIGAIIAYLTGEAAEERVENLQGISKAMLDEHEDAALFALISQITLGVFSLLGLLLTFNKSPFVRTIAFVTFFISIISFGIIGRTGYLGGLIRHTEINSASSVQQDSGKNDNDD